MIPTVIVQVVILLLARDPRDAGASAAFGKLALFADRLSEAESLLTVAVAAGTGTRLNDHTRRWRPQRRVCS